MFSMVLEMQIDFSSWQPKVGNFGSFRHNICYNMRFYSCIKIEILYSSIPPSLEYLHIFTKLQSIIVIASYQIIAVCLLPYSSEHYRMLVLVQLYHPFSVLLAFPSSKIQKSNPLTSIIFQFSRRYRSRLICTILLFLYTRFFLFLLEYHMELELQNFLYLFAVFKNSRNLSECKDKLGQLNLVVFQLERFILTSNID